MLVAEYQEGDAVNMLVNLLEIVATMDKNLAAIIVVGLGFAVLGLALLVK